MRKSAWVLLFCLLFSFPQVSWASTYTITEEELTQLEQNISELQTINNRLQKESSQQKKRMEELETQLTAAQTELQKAREQSDRLGNQLKDLERTSIRQEESLRIANLTGLKRLMDGAMRLNQKTMMIAGGFRSIGCFNP